MSAIPGPPDVDRTPIPGLIKGPAIFFAQFAGDDAPFNSLENIVKGAAGRGWKGDRIPTFEARLFHLDKAAESDTCCDETRGIYADAGVAITDLSTHLQGPLVAVHPADDEAVDANAPNPRGAPGLGSRSA